MAMTADDRVDPLGEGAREREDLPAASGRHVASAVSADMPDHDDDIGATRAKRTGACIDDRCRWVEAEPGDVRCPRRQRSGLRRDANDPDADAAACDERVVRDPLDVTA